MFFSKKAKKDVKTKVHSPLNGEVISLESVPDPVFSQKMMGDGIGFIPTNGEVASPINGEVIQVFPTKHAIGMLADDGVELLIHLGLETVELNGEGFHIDVESGDKLQVNDKIGSFDLDFIEEKGKEIISVLVFSNLNEKEKEMNLFNLGEVEAGVEIADLK